MNSFDQTWKWNQIHVPDCLPNCFNICKSKVNTRQACISGCGNTTCSTARNEQARALHEPTKGGLSIHMHNSRCWQVDSQ